MTTGLTLGFTGTRQGMTEQQILEVIKHVHTIFKPDVVQHGCARGADRQFALNACVTSRLQKMIGYPCDIKHEQDQEAIALCDEVRPEKPPLDRNRDIVQSSDVILAAPAEATEQHRGGTWYTIRYAKKLGKRTIIILPDGRVEEFNHPR